MAEQTTTVDTSSQVKNEFNFLASMIVSSSDQNQDNFKLNLFPEQVVGGDLAPIKGGQA